MPIQFTKEQLAFQDMARRFAQRKVEPLANLIDAEEHTPDELTAKAAEVGLFGLYIPAEYGGSGADVVSACLVAEEIAKASPAFAGALTVQMILCPKTVEILGTEEQKRRILPLSASGERLLAYSQSEPAGAANVAAHLTRLEPHSDGSWRLDGAKLFCTQATAKTYLVMRKTRTHDGREGYGCIIVEQEAEGFSVGPYERKLGWRGSR
jgi:alkylation response protein AidB-like acyl-CoA dehydrogenase